jgi:hypothetical protein
MISKEDQQQIKAFVANPAMVEAVRRVLLPERDVALEADLALDDAMYGRLVKARVIADTMLRDRFAELQRIASSNPQPAPKNEAR